MVYRFFMYIIILSEINHFARLITDNTYDWIDPEVLCN